MDNRTIWADIEIVDWDTVEEYLDRSEHPEPHLYLDWSKLPTGQDLIMEDLLGALLEQREHEDECVDPGEDP